MPIPKEKESELTGADAYHFFIVINHTIIIQTCTNDSIISYNNWTYHYDSRSKFHEIIIMIYSVRNKLPNFLVINTAVHFDRKGR
jgi:hypothetical protein